MSAHVSLNAPASTTTTTTNAHDDQLPTFANNTSIISYAYDAHCYSMELMGRVWQRTNGWSDAVSNASDTPCNDNTTE